MCITDPRCPPNRNMVSEIGPTRVAKGNFRVSAKSSARIPESVSFVVPLPICVVEFGDTLDRALAGTHERREAPHLTRRITKKDQKQERTSTRLVVGGATWQNRPYEAGTPDMFVLSRLLLYLSLTSRMPRTRVAFPSPLSCFCAFKGPLVVYGHQQLSA